MLLSEIYAGMKINRPSRARIIRGGKYLNECKTNHENLENYLLTPNAKN